MNYRLKIEEGRKSIKLNKEIGTTSKNVIGSAAFFGINSLMKEALVHQEIKNARIHPDDLHVQLESMSNSGPIFVETQNYFSLPKCGNSLLCALMLPGLPKIWRLGIIH